MSDYLTEQERQYCAERKASQAITRTLKRSVTTKTQWDALYAEAKKTGGTARRLKLQVS